MKCPVAKTYKPAELEAAVAVLCSNPYHNFHPNDARGIVIALHKLGFRIVHVGTIDSP